MLEEEKLKGFYDEKNTSFVDDGFAYRRVLE